MKKLIYTAIAVILLIAIQSFHMSNGFKSNSEILKAAKEGWWIRIKADRTEVEKIDFKIGTDNKNVEDWKTWEKNEETEFEVPDKYKLSNSIYIKAVGNPEGKNAWFCVLYKNNGVKHFDFDGKDGESHQMKQTDHDDECE